MLGDFLQFGRRLNRKLRPAGSACGRGYPARTAGFASEAGGRMHVRVPPGFAHGSAGRPRQLHNGSIRVGRRAADRRSALAAPQYPNTAYGRRLRAKRAAAERVLSEQR